MYYYNILHDKDRTHDVEVDIDQTFHSRTNWLKFLPRCNCIFSKLDSKSIIRDLKIAKLPFTTT